MTIDSKTYHVPPGKKLNLSEWPTAAPSLTKSKKHYQKLLQEHVKDLSALQQLHYAANRHALLLIFQGMDAAGKDGAIRHVMSGINPQGCEVFSFKQPSAARRRVCRRGRLGSSSIGRADRARCFSLVPPLGDGEAKTPQPDQQSRPPAPLKTGQSGVLLKRPGECDEASSQEAECDRFELDAPLQFVEPAEIPHECPHGEG